MNKFKRIFTISISLLFFSSIVTAQDSSVVAKYAKDLRTKFAVPDAPAFNILSETPSDILKPASVKDIAIGFSGFLGDDNKLTLPKSFALEFAPGLLINGKNLTLDDYRKNAWLYRLRLSLATSRMDNAKTATNLAFGIRVTINDESDPRTNKEYIDEATKLAKEIQDIIDERRKVLGPTATIAEIENDQKLISAKKDLIDKFRVKWLEEKWNKNISELAVAVKASSKDSLAQNVVLSKFSFWFTTAFGIEDWGQFLFGANANSEKDLVSNKFQSSGSLASRFYAGTNNYKVYFQIEGTLVENSKSKWLFNSGLEIKVQENIWAEFTAGIENSNQLSQSSLVTDFKLKYGL